MSLSLDLPGVLLPPGFGVETDACGVGVDFAVGFGVFGCECGSPHLNQPLVSLPPGFDVGVGVCLGVLLPPGFGVGTDACGFRVDFAVGFGTCGYECGSPRLSQPLVSLPPGFDVGVGVCPGVLLPLGFGAGNDAYGVGGDFVCGDTGACAV